ncbi:MAG: leucine-rich repeat protein [Clostridia bacterium]|nr:leucine-rich repeat protein [Clostridia bacterium]
MAVDNQEIEFTEEEIAYILSSISSAPADGYGQVSKNKAIHTTAYRKLITKIEEKTKKVLDVANDATETANSAEGSAKKAQEAAQAVLDNKVSKTGDTMSGPLKLSTARSGGGTDSIKINPSHTYDEEGFSIGYSGSNEGKTTRYGNGCIEVRTVNSKGKYLFPTIANEEDTTVTIATVEEFNELLKNTDYSFEFYQYLLDRLAQKQYIKIKIHTDDTGLFKFDLQLAANTGARMVHWGDDVFEYLTEDTPVDENGQAYHQYSKSEYGEYTITLYGATVGAAYALSGRGDIYQVIVGGGVKKIETGFAWTCHNLREVILEEGVEEIGDCAFGNLYLNMGLLTSVKLPSSVKTLYKTSFARQAGLILYVSSETPPELLETTTVEASAYPFAPTKIIIPYNLVDLYKTTWTNYTSLMDAYAFDKSVEEVRTKVDNVQINVEEVRTKVDNVEEIAVTASVGVGDALGRATEAKEIAENAETLAKGANPAIVFDDYSAMVSYLNTTASDKYIVGQNVLIRTLNVPDLWISEVSTESVEYAYVSDEDTVTALTSGTLQIGYYVLSPLETQKVDLSDYVKNTDYATSTKVGLIKASTGFYISKEGLLTLIGATPDQIDKAVSNSVAITPVRLGYAVGTTYLKGESAPITETVAKFIGQLYLDTTDNATYQCTAITTDESTSVTTYTWVKLIRSTDYPESEKAGAIKVSFGNSNAALYRDAQGRLLLGSPTEEEIKAKTAKKAIVPSNLDYAVKVGITTNAETLTDEEKTSACEWLGAATEEYVNTIANGHYIYLSTNVDSVAGYTKSFSFLVGVSAVDWGDGTVERYTNTDSTTIFTHEYSTNGSYDIKIYGVTDTATGVLVDGTGAFAETPWITSIEIGGGVKTMASNMLVNQQGIVEIKINKGVEKINCQLAGNMSSIVIPESVTSISSFAFYYDLPYLKTIYMQGVTPPSIEISSLNLSVIEKIIVPYESLEAYKTAWTKFTSLIDSYAFVSEVEEKISRTSVPAQAYITDANGEQDTLTYGQEAASYYLAQRNAAGNLVGNTPVDDDEYTPKAYVDEALENKSGKLYYHGLLGYVEVDGNDYMYNLQFLSGRSEPFNVPADLVSYIEGLGGELVVQGTVTGLMSSVYAILVGDVSGTTTIKFQGGTNDTGKVAVISDMSIQYGGVIYSL